MILLYIFFAVLVGSIARSWNRGFISWVLLAIITSPLIAGMLLLIIGRDKQA